MDASNDIVNYYLTIIEHVEQIKLFVEDGPQHYPMIHQKLIDCCQELDLIITLETNHCSFLALCQQKQQFITLAGIISNLMKNELFPCIVFFNANLPQNQEFHNNFPQKQSYENDKQANNTTIQIPKISGLKEIIGLQDIKKTLKSLVILPRTQPQLFYNRKTCNTILLYGPPGTGKTVLVHALAAEANAIFHCISASDVLSRYVGETEKTIKTVFQSLKNSCQLTILFIDEIDALCRKRTSTEQDYNRRVKTEFMCQMSSTEDSKSLIIICATNCPWDLDSAILRRLQKRIYVPLPNQFERLEFFRYLTNNIYFEDVIDWTPLIQKTEGYSGSDLNDVVQSALTSPLNELEDTKVWKYSIDGFYEPVLQERDFSNVICSELRDLPPNSVRARKVRLADLLNAADTVNSTIPPNEIKKYEKFHRVSDFCW